MRDEFPKAVIDVLAKRAGTLCSNPQCSVPTYGPSDNPNKHLSKGVAAHVNAASSGGPRYDENMTPEQRRDIANAIWLCESCAATIDKDEKRYTKETILRWKLLAEERALRALECARIVNISADFADTVLLVNVQTRPFPYSQTQTGRVRRAIKLCEPLRLPRTVLDAPFNIHISDKPFPPGCRLLSLAVQNQGTGVDRYIKFDIEFHDPSSQIIECMPDSDRIQLSTGGIGGSLASFFVRELLPNEAMGVAILAKSQSDFNVGLWTENRKTSPEVFVVGIDYGDEEKV